MLPIPPTTKELKNAYEKLLSNKEVASESSLATWCVWSRFDPRLTEILVQYFLKNFIRINPLLIKTEIKKLNSLPVLCVLVDVVDLNQKNQDTNSDWKIWKNSIQKGASQSPFQSFYVAVRIVSPDFMLNQIKKNLKPFSRWGFYCDEIPLSQKTLETSTRTQIGKKQRFEILQDLLKNKTEITVNDYIHSLDDQIHRRQAERDLSEYSKLKKTGNTRGRIYKKI